MKVKPWIVLLPALTLLLATTAVAGAGEGNVIEVRRAPSRR